MVGQWPTTDLFRTYQSILSNSRVSLILEFLPSLTCSLTFFILNLMKSPLNPVAVLLLASTAALSLRAQNNSANDDKPEPYGIRFRLSGRTQFNIKASVTDSKPILLGTRDYLATVMFYPAPILRPMLPGLLI